MIESGRKFVVTHRSALLNILTGVLFLASAVISDNALKIPFVCIAIVFTWRGLSILQKQRSLNKEEE